MSRYLSNFTILNTSEIEEIRSIFADVYNARSFDLAKDHDRFSATVAYFPLDSSSISYGAHDTPIRVEFRESDFTRIQLCISSSGRTSAGNRSADVDPTTAVCSPADALVECGPSFEQLALRVKNAALLRDLTSLLGTPPKKPIAFDMVARRGAGQTRRLHDMILHTAQNADVSADPIPSPLLREIDETIRLAVLFGIPNNFSSHLNADVRTSAPWQVRRVEEWIDANWKGTVTIDKLVEISGASLRSIFATFKDARGYTPMAYLKKVRLKAAREMLLRAEPRASVTGIGFACNFMNPSHFAKDYQRQFGELPSETLRRNRKIAS